MFVRRKESAYISDEEPTFHVRYLGCTETYVPVGSGCASRHIQKLWDNAASERNLRRVTVKLGLAGVLLKGLREDAKVKVADGGKNSGIPGGESKNCGKEGSMAEKSFEKCHAYKDNALDSSRRPSMMSLSSEEECSKGRVEILGHHGSNINHSVGKAEKKQQKCVSRHASTRHFKLENISYCAADTSVNNRIFCWISKRHSSMLLEASYKDKDGDKPVQNEVTSGPLEVHAVLCSTSDKAQTMAAVMSRTFHLAYKDWCAERQRETRKQQQRISKMAATADDSSSFVEGKRQGENGDCKCNNAGDAELHDIVRSKLCFISNSSSASSLSSSASQYS